MLCWLSVVKNHLLVNDGMQVDEVAELEQQPAHGRLHGTASGLGSDRGVGWKHHPRYGQHGRVGHKDQQLSPLPALAGGFEWTTLDIFSFHQLKDVPSIRTNPTCIVLLAGDCKNVCVEINGLRV